MDTITVETTVNAPMSKVWEYWNSPSHITKWAFASDDWECPSAENDLRIGGTFKTAMASKDGKEQFEIVGTYSEVKNNELVEYDMADKRHVKTEFSQTSDGVKIRQTFDPENENPDEMQRGGWQAILENFKKYVESK